MTDIKHARYPYQDGFPVSTEIARRIKVCDVRPTYLLLKTSSPAMVFLKDFISLMIHEQQSRPAFFAGIVGACILRRLVYLSALCLI